MQNNETISALSCVPSKTKILKVTLKKWNFKVDFFSILVFVLSSKQACKIYWYSLILIVPTRITPLLYFFMACIYLSDVSVLLYFVLWGMFGDCSLKLKHNQVPNHGLMLVVYVGSLNFAMARDWSYSAIPLLPFNCDYIS